MPRSPSSVSPVLFGSLLDEKLLVNRVRSEGAEDALTILRELAASGKGIGEDQLRDALGRLHSNPRQLNGDERQ